MLLTERTEFHQSVGKAQPRGSPRTARARPGARPAHLPAHRFRRPRRGGARARGGGTPLAARFGRAPAPQSGRDPAEPRGPGAAPRSCPDGRGVPGQELHSRFSRPPPAGSGCPGRAFRYAKTNEQTKNDRKNPQNTTANEASALKGPRCGGGPRQPRTPRQRLRGAAGSRAAPRL